MLVQDFRLHDSTVNDTVLKDILGDTIDFDGDFILTDDFASELILNNHCANHITFNNFRDIDLFNKTNHMNDSIIDTNVDSDFILNYDCGNHTTCNNSFHISLLFNISRVIQHEKDGDAVLICEGNHINIVNSQGKHHTKRQISSELYYD
ncbi:unnamed protein product [Rotaria sp. Silwood1]|nr:unnamed protein product [Rotaria sp. Silwood1]CAF5024828.1 unnamed protein product [Rotaria sp. Silwood1]